MNEQMAKIEKFAREWLAGKDRDGDHHFDLYHAVAKEFGLYMTVDNGEGGAHDIAPTWLSRTVSGFIADWIEDVKPELQSLL